MVRRIAWFVVALTGAVTSSVQASPARAEPAVCLAGDDHPRWVAVRQGKVELCLETSGPERARCYAVALESGTLSPLPLALPGPDESLPNLRPKAGRPKLAVGENSVEVVREGRVKILQVAGEVDPGLGLTASVNSAGTRVAVAYLDSTTRIEVFDAARGLRMGAFAGRFAGLDCAWAEPIGDGVLVVERECGADTGRGYLTTLGGQLIAELGGKKRIAPAQDPVYVDGNRWAFTSARGDEVVVQDVVTGKVSKRLALGKGKGKGPAAPVVAAAEGSTLVVVYGGARLGELAVVDLARLRVRKLRAPRCPGQ